MKNTRAAFWLRIVLSAILCFAAVRFAARRWDREQPPEVYAVSVLANPPEGAPEGALTLRLTGAGLFRVNTLRAEGRRVPVLYSGAQGYSECYLSVAKDTFFPGKTYRLRVGKRYPFPFGELYRSGEFAFVMD